MRRKIMAIKKSAAKKTAAKKTAAKKTAAKKTVTKHVRKSDDGERRRTSRTGAKK
jgi:RNA polymerase primary sigma factor